MEDIAESSASITTQLPLYAGRRKGSIPTRRFVMGNPPQLSFLGRLKAALTPRTSAPVSPSFEGAPRTPSGILSKKKIVWKDAPHRSEGSATASSLELERIVQDALPNKKESPGAIRNFVELAKDALNDIAAPSAASLIPGAGAVAGLASAGQRAYQAQSTGNDAEHLKDTFGATSPDLQMCSLSMARYLKKQQTDQLKHAARDVAGAAANVAVTATGAGAVGAPLAGLGKLAAERIAAVRNLWERYEAMQQGNNFLARAGTDPTNYYHAVEACPELAAYVLATCDPDGVSAKLGDHSLSAAHIAKIRKIAVEMIKESPLEIRTGEPPQSGDVVLRRFGLVGGDAVGEILAQDVGRPKSAVERVSLWKKNQVVPFDDSAASAPAVALSNAPGVASSGASEPRPRKYAWGPSKPARPEELPPILDAWPEHVSESSTPLQLYSRSASQALVEG